MLRGVTLRRADLALAPAGSRAAARLGSLLIALEVGFAPLAAIVQLLLPAPALVADRVVAVGRRHRRLRGA